MAAKLDVFAPKRLHLPCTRGQIRDLQREGENENDEGDPPTPKPTRTGSDTTRVQLFELPCGATIRRSSGPVEHPVTISSP
jgi:hypothetical protein